MNENEAIIERLKGKDVSQCKKCGEYCAAEPFDKFNTFFYCDNCAMNEVSHSGWWQFSGPTTQKTL